MMKENGMRAGVARGEAQFGTWINMIRNPAILPLLKAAGLDYARVDMEHSAATMETIADMAVVARAIDLPIVVRPPHASREWITRLLDIGVYNLQCPQVESAAHAREIVAASRYAPMGQRGVGGLSASTDFETTGTDEERRAFANSQVFITVMFETIAALDDLDEIAAMDGIDALAIGNHDLAQDLGIAGTPDEARIIAEKRELIIAAAKKHGKTCALVVSSAKEAEELTAAGALILIFSNDVEMLHGAFAKTLASLKGQA